MTMDEPANETLSDPGQFWRRTMRCGVLVFFLLLYIEWKVEGISPADLFCRLASVARCEDVGAEFRLLGGDSPLADWLFRAFACTFLTVFLATPIFALLCTRRILEPGLKRLPYVIAAHVFWFVALVPPYFFWVNQLGFVEDHDTVSLALGLLSALLLLGFITLLNGWRHRSGPQFVFWLGLFPIATCAISMVCLVVSVILIDRFQNAFVLLPLAGLCSAAILMFAWLKWWHAVVQFERRSQVTLILRSGDPLRNE